MVLMAALTAANNSRQTLIIHYSSIDSKARLASTKYRFIRRIYTLKISIPVKFVRCENALLGR
jgi:hypothetical protein